MEKCILKLIWHYKSSAIVNTILEKKNKVVGLKKKSCRTHTSQFENLLHTIVIKQCSTDIRKDRWANEVELRV